MLECSAKNDFNVTAIFKTILTLSRILPVGTNEAATPLKRRSSAYVSATSKGKFEFDLQNNNIFSLVFVLGKGRISSPSLSTDKQKAESSGGNDANQGECSLKPRSRFVFNINMLNFKLER